MTTYSINATSTSNKLEVKKVEYAISLARTGGQGADNKTLGGLTVELSEAQSGDLITIQDNKWVNVRRDNVTDGGNF
jgi:hypothetical protein